MVSPGNYSHAGLRVHTAVRDGETIEEAILRASRIIDKRLPDHAKRALRWDTLEAEKQSTLEDHAPPTADEDDQITVTPT